MSVTLLTSHEPISALNLWASSNIELISVTLLTSHQLISPLKWDAFSNIELMSVMSLVHVVCALFMLI